MDTSCTICKKPDGKACEGCRETPILPFNFHNTRVTNSTYYCGRECQKDHWPTHRRICRTYQARRRAFRAASTLQQVYYVYRVITFDKYVVGIEEIETTDQTGQIDTTGTTELVDPVKKSNAKEKAKDKDKKKGKNTGKGKDKGNDNVGNETKDKIEIKSRKKLYIHEGDYHKLPEFSEPCVFPFPEDLCKDRKTRETVLANLGCADSMVALHELIGYFLNDFTTLSEVTLMTHCTPVETIVRTHLDTALNTIVSSTTSSSSCLPSSTESSTAPSSTTSSSPIPPTSTIPPHGITQVIFKGSLETYALDLSGAQYGLYNTLISWEDYEPYVQATEAVAKFGDTLKSQENLERDYPQYSFALGFAVGLAKGLKGMVEEWEGIEGGLKVVDLWELKREEFEKKQMELVEFVREKFQVVFLESEYLKMREWVCNARGV